MTKTTLKAKTTLNSLKKKNDVDERPWRANSRRRVDSFEVNPE